MATFQSTLTKYNSPYRPATGLYFGAPISQISASGSGLGGSSVVSAAVRARTASGSGAGTQTAIGVRVVLRTATGSGTSGDSAVISGAIQYRLNAITDYSFPYLAGGRYYLGARILTQTATGSGIGSTSGNASGLHISPRTASGSGVGSAVFESRITNRTTRTASASGVGASTAVGVRVVARTASGSGTSTQTAIWVKSRMFRVPQTTNFAFVIPEESWKPRTRLFARLPNGIRVENLFRLSDATYTINDPRDGSATRTYLGSHVIPLTDEEVSELTAAGYGAYIT